MPDIGVQISTNLQKVGSMFRAIQFGAFLQRQLEELAFLTERHSKVKSPIDTGRMRASITTDIGTLRARIAPHTNYALFVHEGTRFMRARPFMTFGFEAASKELGENQFAARIETHIKEKIK